MGKYSLLGDRAATTKPLLPVLENRSPGVNEKPVYCGNNCPMAYKSTGFIADLVPENPIMAIVDPTPGKQDLIERLPFSGRMGQYVREHVVIPAGVPPDRVLWSYILRCRPRDGYPTGQERKLIERSCRHWDSARTEKGEVLENSGRSLADWKPDLFVLTFAPNKIIEVAAYEALAISDIKKALRFAEAGYRPVVLMGPEGLEFAAPWLMGTGGIKNWRGHWWEGEWRWHDDTTETQLPGFATAKKPAWKRIPTGFGGRRKAPAGKQGSLF